MNSSEKVISLLMMSGQVKCFSGHLKNNEAFESNETIIFKQLIRLSSSQNENTSELFVQCLPLRFGFNQTKSFPTTCKLQIYPNLLQTDAKSPPE